MFEGKQDQEWQHTSSQLAMMHNLKCSKKSQMKAPNHFNPMLQGEKKQRLSKSETTLKLRAFLHNATNGNYLERKVKYELRDGAYVLVESKE